MIDKNEILKKLNFDVKNSNRVVTNSNYFSLSKLQLIFYNLLNINIFYSFVKLLISIVRKFENLIKIKNIKLQSLDPNISPKEKKFNSLKSNNELNQKYGYDEFTEIKRFYANAKLVKSKNNSGLFLDRVNYSINETEKIINLDKSIKKLVSVGCSYAHYEHVISKKFKKIKVECFDRSEVTAILNKKEFPLSNINVSFGDIIDFISKQDSDYSIFNHMWTLAYLPKDFVEQIYSELNKINTKYIILVESIGISRETGKMYKFGFKDLPSVRWKNNIFIHNYPGILNKYGYSIENLDLTEIPQNKNEYLLKIVAKKIMK